jgi:hypothetical protein
MAGGRCRCGISGPAFFCAGGWELFIAIFSHLTDRISNPEIIIVQVPAKGKEPAKVIFPVISV